MDELEEELGIVGTIANQYDMQLSTHPSQYFVLNSLREEVVAKTIESLNLFAEMLKRMQLKYHPNIILHVGIKSSYETAQEACDAFCANFERLSDTTKSYLVIENDHVSFTVEDCMYIHKKIGIPVVFDKKHAHDDYVLITDYLELENAIEKTGIPTCYVMLECKRKDEAVLKLYEYRKEVE